MVRFDTLLSADRRGAARHVAHERARLLIGAAIRRCIVVDLSASGARIGLGADNPLPLRFEIEFAGGGRRVPVQLIWQRGLTAGIRFDLRPTLLERLNVLAWFKNIR